MSVVRTRSNISRTRRRLYMSGPPMLPPPEDTPHGPHIDQEEAHAQDMGDEGPIPNDLGVHEEHRRDAGAEAVQQEGRKVDFGEKHPGCPSEPVHPCGWVILIRR